MKRVRNILLAIMAAIMATACGESRHIDDSLARAEAVMQEHPDSALALLQAIDTDDLSTGRGRALHALLLSQAYDKNYIDLTDDSLISIAVDHFASSDDHYHAMLAHYYHGRVLYNANKLAESSVAFIEAERHALGIKDHLCLGMLYSWMAYVYNYSYNFDEELKYAKKSLDHFQKHGDAKYIGNSFISLAEAYNNTNAYSKSEEVFLKAKDFANSINDTTLMCRAIRGFAHVRKVQTDFNAVKKYLKMVLIDYDRPINAVDYCHLSEAYCHENKTDSAAFYLKKGEGLSHSAFDSVAVAKARCCYYKTIGDYENALKWESKVNSKRYSTLQEIWQQAVVKSQRDFMILKAQSLETEKQKQRTYYTALACLLVLVIISLYVFLRHKRFIANLRLKRLEEILIQQKNNTQERLKQNQEEITRLANSLKDAQSQNDILHQNLESKKSELEWINEQIAHNIQQKQTAEIAIKKTDIYFLLREKLSEETTIINTDEWEIIANTIDLYYPQFRPSLLSLCNISQTEMRVCMLLKLSFSSTDISRFLNMSRSNPSTIKSRLYAKIFKKQGSAKDFDDFLNKL